ncbi:MULTISPECIES: N-acetyltransferase [unclassified Pseudofrankia]|uniref:GNAT family N-acetyltransferase n=1 Tax=unclassified Pseudofrankia TaxID=2994372 RepID=UPI0008D99B76|nr:MULTISPECIES: GNAT family N-acetyltransferase [unclassified Pseudofrankia]MDT3444578.1 GNAT family N-acetyltransferase [Pseudofrankia sp. BMG5.37]OHV47462.1 GCN5 family acetyltransferase [Pseudofrankia sp. BMG5.36]
MPEPVEVRRAVTADAAEMAGLADRSYRPYVARMDGRRPGPMDADYAATIDDAEVWVVDGPAHRLRAFLVLVPGPDGLLLENIAVDPVAQGRGLGGALLRLAEEQALAHAHTSIWLYTHVSMVENQRIYAARGYVETHRATDNGLERIFYRKTLD